jgi:hypothetical protein
MELGRYADFCQITLNLVNLLTEKLQFIHPQLTPLIVLLSQDECWIHAKGCDVSVQDLKGGSQLTTAILLTERQVSESQANVHVMLIT